MWGFIKYISLFLLAFFALAGIYYQSATSSGVKFLSEQPQNPLMRIAYIAGAIKTPGVYELTSDMRVADLIQLAGGLLPEADLDFVHEKLNLAKILEDEQHVVIPVRDLLSGSDTPVSKNTSSGKVSLNQSSQAQLETLPGVGPAMAGRIISARPFESIDQLQEVSGVGDVVWQKLKDLVEI